MIRRLQTCHESYRSLPDRHAQTCVEVEHCSWKECVHHVTKATRGMEHTRAYSMVAAACLD